METCSVLELEKTIFEIENILVVLRVKSNIRVYKYPHTKKADETMSVKEFLDTRINPLIGVNSEAAIISGNYNKPHPTMKLEKLRESYHN